MSQRRFVRGDTVHLRASLFHPVTGAPVDPSTVRLETFTKTGVPVALNNKSFARQETGSWLLEISTAHLGAGVYDYRIEIEGDLGTVHLDESFILVE